MLQTALSSRMGRRIGGVLCACAILPLLVFAGMTMRQSASIADERLDQRLNSISRVISSDLLTRLGAAEAILRTLSAQDIGDGLRLKEQAVDSPVFKSVVLVGREGLSSDGRVLLRPSPEQLVAVETGQTVLTSAVLQGQLPTVFLMRSVTSKGVQRLAYFELAPEWLWHNIQSPSSDVVVAVVDVQGRILQSVSAMSAETGRMFANHIDLAGERTAATRPIAWQAEHQEWQGVLAHVPLANDGITGTPLAVVAFSTEPTVAAYAQPLILAVPLAVAFALVCVFAGALYLAWRYLPALLELRVGFAALQARRFERAPLTGYDEPRALIEVFNRSAASIQDQFRALETLGEIDRLLLSSADLEQVLESILSRVQAVTRCHSVGIALRDADAPGRGRVYLAANGLVELPVSRVALDNDMLTTLATETHGLTVARCEDTRHSFLKPLKELGSEIFWVWPVIAGEQVEAILSVGYREAPMTDPQIARYGSEFAARLAVALSKNARDERLYRQAHYDPLTALPNRLLFRDRLSQELSNAASGLSRGALLYIDLDHFKKVNDTVGHSAGDQLLTIVAQRLRSCVKDGDTVARLGGDEFTVILRNVVDPDAARSIAERIVESLQLPVNIAGRDHFVCASIGITLFPDDGTSIEELVRNADTAMYRAKELGRGRTMFFERTMSSKNGPPTDSGLHRALRRREFSLFYQPQFLVADGSLAGVEALLRWQTPRDGLRQPNDFVPAAEESGLIVDIGGWVLDTACAQLAVWRDKGIAPPRLSVNVSAQQLRHVEFPKVVRRALDKYGLSADLLELELTENVFTDEAAGAALGRLAQAGVRLALDDFGTGYSSLSYLRQFPIGSVKIDRAFLEDVPHNAGSSTLVETIIVMAHALGKRVVAEGIETIEQLDFLRERRCDLVQGFYLARPLAAAEMTDLLQARIAIAARDGSDVRAVG